MIHESSESERSLLSYGIEFHKNLKKRCRQSVVLAYFPGEISQQRSTNQYGSKIVWISFVNSFHSILLFLEVK